MADAHQVELPQVDPSNEGKAATQHLWEAVRVGGVGYDNDRQALEAMCATVPTELGASLAIKATAKLTWESIAVERIGGDRVGRATLQRLHQEWEGLAF